MQWLKSKPSLPPGMNPADVEASKPKTGDSTAGMSKAAKKNAKRREKKKQQADSEKTMNSVVNSMSEAKISSNQADKSRLDINQSGDSKLIAIANQSDSVGGGKTETEKKLRNLRKKLKQIEDIEKRIKSGELAKPEKEQLEKVAKKEALISEIEDLELDLED